MKVTLSGLRVFDAAARHLSFKEAAQELALSPSAVSHAITKLERELGVLLFDRDARSLTLTLDGETLARPTEEAFGLIRSGLDAVSARRAHVLRLHAAPSFAALWLTPRLARFLADHPGMAVRIAASTDYSRFAADEFDADITYMKREQDGLVYHPLGTERITPMCSPEMAKTIRTPADLVGATLIRSTLKRVTWEDWFAENGITPADTATMRFDRSFMSLAAAADGLGVCLDSTRLAARDLAAGRLVCPLEGRCRDLEENDHFLVYPRRSADRPIVRAFTRWILAELSDPNS